MKNIYEFDIDGLRRIKLDEDEYNLIDKDGNLICKQNYHFIYDLDDSGLRMVLLDNEYNLIDKNENLICKQNYKKIFPLEEDGFRKVQLSKNEYNLLDSKGKLFFYSNHYRISNFINDKRTIKNIEVLNYSDYKNI